MKLSVYFFVYFLLGFNLFVSSNPIKLSDGLDKKNLKGTEVLGFVDQKNLSLKQVLELYKKQSFDMIFKSNSFDNSSDMSANYWMAIVLQNNSKMQEFFLELHDPHLGSVQVFSLENDSLVKLGESGSSRPFNLRSIHHKNHFFLISIKSGFEKVFFIKMHSPQHATMLASVVSIKNMVDYSLREYWFLGIYYGALVILLIYNLVLFLNVRQYAYLWYSSYVAACIFNAFREDGLGFQFLWPDLAALNQYHFDVSMLLLLITFCGFAESFLGLRTKIRNILIPIIGLIVLYAIVHYVESNASRNWDIASYLYPGPYIFVYLAALYFALQKDKPSIYFLIGFTSFILGVLIFLLRVKGFIPNTIYTIYAPNFSVLSEVAIMSYALASRYRKQNEELRLSQAHELEWLLQKAELDSKLIQEMSEKTELKESINRELEKKVTERTKELNFKNNELAELNTQLSFYKEKLEHDWVRLDKEKWELSKKVNESIFDNIKGKEVSLDVFQSIFPSNDVCLFYISELKWKNGFICKQCNNTKFIKGSQLYSRKCTKCALRETATAGTLFHGIKFDLTKAFYITHITLFDKDNHATKDLAQLLDLRIGTCSNFRKKVEQTQLDLYPKNNWENIILVKKNN